jgi:hypothetical protein
MTAEGKNERISTPALSEVQSALKAYWTVLETSELSAASKGIYMDMAENFVRRLKGDFTPGSRKDPIPSGKEGKTRWLPNPVFRLPNNIHQSHPSRDFIGNLSEFLRDMLIQNLSYSERDYDRVLSERLLEARVSLMLSRMVQGARTNSGVTAGSARS